MRASTKPESVKQTAKAGPSSRPSRVSESPSSFFTSSAAIASTWRSTKLSTYASVSTSSTRREWSGPCTVAAWLERGLGGAGGAVSAGRDARHRAGAQLLRQAGSEVATRSRVERRLRHDRGADRGSRRSALGAAGRAVPVVVPLDREQAQRALAAEAGAAAAGGYVIHGVQESPGGGARWARPGGRRGGNLP